MNNFFFYRKFSPVPRSSTSNMSGNFTGMGYTIPKRKLDQEEPAYAQYGYQGYGQQSVDINDLYSSGSTYRMGISFTFLLCIVTLAACDRIPTTAAEYGQSNNSLQSFDARQYDKQLQQSVLWGKAEDIHSSHYNL